MLYENSTWTVTGRLIYLYTGDSKRQSMSIRLSIIFIGEKNCLIGRDDIIKRFLTSGRPGFYLAVLQEGELGAGDTIELIRQEKDQPTIAEIVR